MFKFTESIELTNKQANKETFQKRLKRYNSGEFQDLKRKNNCIKERFKNQKLSTTEIRKFNYSESQIYEYIARVFYNVGFSTYLGSNTAEKRV